jgi:hypothetical protein
MRSATKKRTGRDKPYLAWLHTQSCAVFEKRWEATGLLSISPCQGRMTAHHAGDHGASQKPPDRTAIPLCDHHHQRGPHAIHGPLGKRFWEFHGVDRDAIIGELNRKFEEEHGNRSAI